MVADTAGCKLQSGVPVVGSYRAGQTVLPHSSPCGSSSESGDSEIFALLLTLGSNSMCINHELTIIAELINHNYSMWNPA